MTERMTEAVEILNPDGRGRVVLLCEHASNHIPAEYDALGLSSEAQVSHAAWDPGARALTVLLSEALDAPAVMSRVSRLVYDCNRPPEAPGAMPEKSELIEVPGNKDLSQAAREARTRAVYEPFCKAVSAVLDARNRDAVVVTIHSFTPVYFGQARAVEMGLLHDEDSRLVDAMLEQAHRLGHRRIARNDPYGPEDGVTHSLKRHALSRGLANVMVEIRNDLIKTQDDVATLADEVLTLLHPALDNMALMEGGS